MNRITEELLLIIAFLASWAFIIYLIVEEPKFSEILSRLFGN